MPNQEAPEEQGRSKTSNGPWIALITAVGVTATAVVVAHQIRKKRMQAHVEDFLSLCSSCDRASQTLEDRLGLGEGSYQTA